MRILMVEDDEELSEAVHVSLSENGHTVDVCHTGDDGLHFARQNAYDCILLDRMLPNMDGLTILREIRRAGVTAPVILVTAMNGIGDRVDGLDTGADDYLVKPFAMEELLARIRALSRRPQQWESVQALVRGDLTLDTDILTLTGPSGRVTLSKREAQLLEFFLRNPSQILPRSLLLSRVWGPDAPVEDGNLDNYIHFLRRRLRTVGSELKIETIRSVGYRFNL